MSEKIPSTFTAAAFTAAGAGVTFVKHGNRGATSKCGSADVLEALGIKIDISSERVCEIIDENGIGFMFAQSHHPAMKYAGRVRKEISVSSILLEYRCRCPAAWSL